MPVINIGPLGADANINVQDTSSVDLSWDPTGDILSAVVLNAGVDHGGLAGLADDDHTQYLLLAGRAGGQSPAGGNAASENLTLRSTSHATKGKILFGTSAYDEVNDRLGIKTVSPAFPIDIDPGTSFVADVVLRIRESHADGFRPTLRLTNSHTGGKIYNLFSTNSADGLGGGLFVIHDGDANAARFIINSSGIISLPGASQYIDLSAISAGNPNLKITGTSDTPTVAFTGGGNAPTTAPAGYLEILVGASARYIPFWA